MFNVKLVKDTIQLLDNKLGSHDTVGGPIPCIIEGYRNEIEPSNVHYQVYVSEEEFNKSGEIPNYTSIIMNFSGRVIRGQIYEYQFYGAYHKKSNYYIISVI